MLDKISNHLNFFQDSLALRAKKAEVIASNIANADTPTYKAVDFDFGQALRKQVAARGGEQSGGLQLDVTNPNHLTARGSSDDQGGLQYRSTVQPSLDGNTVDMDIERAAFTDNAMKYQSTLTFLSRRISGLMEVIKGGQ